MAITAWTYPAADMITGSTKISETDDKIQSALNDMNQWINSTGAYVGTGLTQEINSTLTTNQAAIDAQIVTWQTEIDTALGSDYYNKATSDARFLAIGATSNNSLLLDGTTKESIISQSATYKWSYGSSISGGSVSTTHTNVVKTGANVPAWVSDTTVRLRFTVKVQTKVLANGFNIRLYWGNNYYDFIGSIMDGSNKVADSSGWYTFTGSYSRILTTTDVNNIILYTGASATELSLSSSNSSDNFLGGALVTVSGLEIERW